ncbi:competence type IV pilus minor pilin ComGE [Lentibacillus sp. N15]|uniref:competence type IV pilus minor pilin ComGE n=1 Tax=Lentibacillus songyuanensis TaxID=3136161 RepID=UPI0031BA05AD
MKNNKGFTLIEVLVAFSTVVMIATTLLPLISTINKEEEHLSERLRFSNQLYDELQMYLWEGQDRLPPFSFAKTDHSTTLFYQFIKTNDHLIKGCVKWTNVKEKSETICLYGYSTK